MTTKRYAKLLPKSSIGKCLPISVDLYSHNSLSSFGSFSKSGRNHDRSSKRNQDSFVTIPNFMKSSYIHLFGVMDGHGNYGKTISTKISEDLPNFIETLESDHKTSFRDSILYKGKVFREQLMLRAFERAENSLISECAEDSKDSGSTATIVCLIGKILLCANVGDSRAILCSEYNGIWTAEQITIDHKPEYGLERDRIIYSGGIVDACRGKFFKKKYR